MPILTTMIRRKVLLKHSFDKAYNIIGDFDLFVKISLKEKIYSIQEPLAFYRIHNLNMTTNKIDLNIEELEKWLSKNSNKNQFKNYNFFHLEKIIKSLRIKKFVFLKYISIFLEFFKKPINLLNLKYIFYLIMPKYIIKNFKYE